MKTYNFFLNALAVILLMSLLTMQLQSCKTNQSNTSQISVEIIYETPTYQVLMITNYGLIQGNSGRRDYLLAPKGILIPEKPVNDSLVQVFIGHSEIK
jgi:hypothetical protein